MNLRRKITLTIMTVLAFATANAKTASWDILPKYEKLNRYYNDMYAFQKNGKWGLVKSGNKEILPATCDFITPFTNGYALAGTKDSNNYLLEHIIDEDGSVITLTDKYYLPSSNQYVSDGKLVVVNKNGKYGYISPDGRAIIKCQFDYALPFKEGWAPVKQGNYTKYISENYDKNPSKSILTVDFHYGEMTLASSFANGKAAVAYNTDFALIGKNGQKIKKLKETEFKQLYKKNNAASTSISTGFNEVSLYGITNQNGRSGLKEGEKVILIPQFDSFPAQYNDGAILTVSNSKYGVLKISEGDVIITSSVNEIEVDRKGNYPPISISYSTPSLSSASKLFLDLGDGIYKDWTDGESNNGGTFSVMVTPIIAKNSESCVIKGFVENDGIKLTEFEKSFSVNYPIKLRVSSPAPSTIRANENDMATFSSTIFNDSNKQVTVTATWSTGKTVTLTIPAHSSKTTSDTVHVTSNFSKNISLVLSSGEKSHSTINFQTFF